MKCHRCGESITGKPTQWAFWVFHHECYLKETKYLQDMIDECNILLAMKAMFNPKRKRNIMK